MPGWTRGPARGGELRACLLRLKDLARAPVEEPPIPAVRRLRAELRARPRRPDPAAHRRASQRISARVRAAPGVADRLHRFGRRADRARRARRGVRRRPLYRPGRGAARSAAVRAPPSGRGAAGQMAGRAAERRSAHRLRSGLARQAEVERYRAACTRAAPSWSRSTTTPMSCGPRAPRRRSRRSGSWTSATPAKRRTPSARMGQEVAAAGAEVAAITAPDSIAWLLNARGCDVPFNPLFLSFALRTRTARSSCSSTRAS